MRTRVPEARGRIPRRGVSQPKEVWACGGLISVVPTTLGHPRARKVRSRRREQPMNCGQRDLAQPPSLAHVPSIRAKPRFPGSADLSFLVC